MTHRDGRQGPSTRTKGRNATGIRGSGSKGRSGGEREIITVLLSAIHTNPEQPRRYFKQEALDQLAQSIRKHGLLQPIIVKPTENAHFLLVAGERRYRACRMARLREIPAMVTKADELEIALIENLQREDLKPIEEAEGLAALQRKFQYTQAQLAGIVGRSRVSVNESLKLLDLPEVVLEQCRTSDITTKHLLLQVVRESNQRRQLDLWEAIKAGELTVNRARAERETTNAEPRRLSFLY